MTRFIVLPTVSFILAACSSAQDESSVDSGTIGDDPAAGSARQLLPRFNDATEARIVLADLESSDAERDAAFSAFSRSADLTEVQSLSTALWSGRNQDRDRALSVRLAIAAFDREPQSWSALRAGIGLADGIGVEPDLDRAVEVLSHPILKTNPVAPFYLGTAYVRMGDVGAARSAFQKAADMGNARAVEALSKL